MMGNSNLKYIVYFLSSMPKSKVNQPRSKQAAANGRPEARKPRKKSFGGDLIDWTTSEPSTIKPVPYTIDTYINLTPKTFADILLSLKTFGYDIEQVQESLITSSMAAVEKKLDKYKAWFDADEYPVVLLSYPGGVAFERFMLCQPISKLDYDPVTDLLETVFSIAEAFDDEGLKALAEALNAAIMSRSLVEVNLALGRINKNLKALPPLASLRVKLTEVALEQAYRRCVKPHLDLLKLRSKQTWSDEVYGELMPELLEEIFVRANLGKNSLFVDLGSGVGNVVAQASLSTGCASFGIEIRSGPATIAKSLLDEVEARGRIWGLRAGQMDIAEGDALFDGVVKRTVPTADLVLLNNKVWSASLNEKVKTIVREMKVGAVLVSLTSFKSCGTRGGKRQDSFGKSIKETVFSYGPGDVSWGGGAGQYYWSEKLY